MSGEDDQLMTFLLMTFSSVPNVHHLLGGCVDGAWSGLTDELVHQTDVSKGTTHHNLVVATTTAVGVKVARIHIVRHEVACGWTAAGDMTCWTDVIRGDAVTQIQECIRTANLRKWFWFRTHSCEEGRFTNVSRVEIPLVESRVRRLESVPLGGTLLDVRVHLLEEGGQDDCLTQRGDVLSRGPDVTQKHLLTVLILAEWSGLKIEDNVAGQSVGDHQRRRGKVVGTHILVDTSLKVAVAGEDRGGH
mmetsp:Transcript_1651/g.5128  ORF Transcript_1651/g.5128 Transcript_1651/m.5128 type:complete len:247 (+) Transcript_1651:45-785(+)